MPLLIWAFFVTVGVGTGAPVAKALVTPIDHGYNSSDPQPKPKKYKPRPIGFQVSASPCDGTSYATMNPKRQMTCEVTFIAVVTGGHKAQLSVGTVDYGLDSGWTLRDTIPVGQRHRVHFQFLDPKTGKLLTEVDKEVACVEAPDTDFGVLYDKNGILRGY